LPSSASARDTTSPQWRSSIVKSLSQQAISPILTLRNLNSNITLVCDVRALEFLRSLEAALIFQRPESPNAIGAQKQGRALDKKICDTSQ
jgi:hypothetical protein